MTLNDWLREVEAFSTRGERLHRTFAHMDMHDWKALMEWLEAAYEAGYHNAKEAM